MNMAKENNGTVTTAMVVAGTSRGNLKYLVEKGRIEHNWGCDTVVEIMDEIN